MLVRGVKEAKSELSKLVEAALNGETVVITNHGKAMVRLVPETPQAEKKRGIGCLKGVAEYPEHWFTPKGEAAFADLFRELPVPAGKSRIEGRKKS